MAELSALSPLIHSEHYATLMEWIRKPVPRTPCVAFLYGPPGIGKTTLAHRVVNDAGLRAVECNASQFRHKAAMSELIEPLLNSANVGDFFRAEGHRAMGVILDEIDGMSAGDRGGLTELVRILKDYRGPNAIICISNEWQEKRYQPLMRISLGLHVTPPDLATCATWIGTDTAAMEPHWVRHRGDLRKLLQWQSGVADDSNDIVRSLTVQELVVKLLEGPMDVQDELTLDNNDLNLAGLHLHETLPSWIHDRMGSGSNAWNLYHQCLNQIATSDRHDYYTFFHQHWSIFPLSFQSKLQAVNHLIHAAPLSPRKRAPTWKFQYTAVLARQSWLFNQFKYLCELRSVLESSPFRDGGLEIALWVASRLSVEGAETLDTLLTAPPQYPKDRVKRWLSTLVVPPVPPCPIGKV
jgi:hypothetical protein